MDYILNAFEEDKVIYASNKFITSMLNAGWRKMDKYYNLTSETPAYAAAIVLDPNLKWNYIDKNWKDDWIDIARPAVEKFWKKEYKPKAQSAVRDILVPPTESSIHRSHEGTGYKGSLAEFRRGHQNVRVAADEYDHYCQQDCTIDEDPLQWWLQPTQQARYSNLSKMAIDILTIPPMSAEPERVFSGAKFTMSDHRNKLGVDLLKAFECMKSWLKLNDFELNTINQETAESFGRILAELREQTA